MKKQEPVPLGRKLMEAILSDPETIKSPWYRRMFRSLGSGGSGISRSKYKPHQSDREKARRLRQIERGILQR